MNFACCARKIGWRRVYNLVHPVILSKNEKIQREALWEQQERFLLKKS